MTGANTDAPSFATVILNTAGNYEMNFKSSTPQDDKCQYGDLVNGTMNYTLY
jgi:hypothetical protein